MAKFNKTTTTPLVQQVGTTTGTTATYEGGQAWTRDVRSELLLLAVVNMVGEDTFYEKAGVRDDRFANLVREVAVQDPEWMLNFVTWLRDSANMRSASVVAAVEAVWARLDAKCEEPGRNFRGFDFNAVGINRRIIAAACQRADEPGEVLAYWTSRFGRKIPKPVKRGLADAVQRLYNERSFLKWDSDAKGYRMADVLELTHPSPADDKPWQGDLFKYIIDKRHNRDVIGIPVRRLPMIAERDSLMDTPVAERRSLLLSEEGKQLLVDAGMTWESLAGWLQGPMDKDAWEAIIPNMGAMALVRNLRNFDGAGVSDEVAAQVCAKISDPEEIRRSRQFPYRMLSAYLAAPSLRWGHALDKALDATCQNLPALGGKTLVLVDTSSSMGQRISSKSDIRHVDVGALFGVALAARGNQVDLYGFAGSGWGAAASKATFEHKLVKGGSVLKQTEAFTKRVGEVGHGTETVRAIRETFKPGVHQRVVIITDGQAFSDYSGSVSEAVPVDVPLFGIDTTGYAKSSVNTGERNRYAVGGLADPMFKILGMLASGKDAGWPWE